MIGPARGPGTPPLDEQAPPLDAAWGALLELLETGGPVMWIIAGLSVLGLTIVLVKLIDFAAAGAWRQRAAQAALADWCRGDCTAALERLESRRGPVAEVLHTAMSGRLDANRSDDLVREDVARSGAQWLERLRGGLRPLELIGSLAPLLGLVFFMLASSFLDWRAFPLGLPPADATPDPNTNPVVVNVGAGGSLRIDGRTVAPDGLVERIGSLRGDEPEHAVVVQPAGDATVATTVEVLDRLRAAGVAGVSLATTPP